jgi:hypothetical protein
MLHSWQGHLRVHTQQQSSVCSRQHKLQRQWRCYLDEPVTVHCTAHDVPRFQQVACIRRLHTSLVRLASSCALRAAPLTDEAHGAQFAAEPNACCCCCCCCCCSPLADIVASANLNLKQCLLKESCSHCCRDTAKHVHERFPQLAGSRHASLPMRCAVDTPTEPLAGLALLSAGIQFTCSHAQQQAVWHRGLNRMQHREDYCV